MTDATAPPTETPVPRELGTVYVTGGSSGLGAALVEAVTAAGGKPVVLDRVPPSAEVPHAVVDLADSAAAADAVERLAVEVGPPDAVVTAAGTDACGPLAEISVEHWERVVRVNLLGTVAVVRAALPFLEQRRGTVVTVASTLGLKGVSDATAYCASKFGVRGFSQALAAELAGRVGVTCLVPGGMRTAFFDGRPEQYKPGPDADLADPRATAAAAVTALRQPVGVEIREMLVAASGESSWP
ncbi:NADP-dependent 3-hydroxy acid dehydrogenase YdfG [Isoptericola sp. CG 20/1183]|uniref:NADP-dependent 3-hydroxy acid dehydrogenase YdfG n=1 Tax=Isoptericola halotolerans TaxID=300560 RepID=A0ABX5EAN9_9MICO|nr:MULTISPECIES: SDR family oxidoreductase [Isoptericola]PRZ02660.1 NADP-dependent 3-hydroxy acid dehydrogenase YdfG [Isoptericola sp. CG 20/1183]PRZ03012.1 NADP-dependent 3-hydroxy acid dehydrogenase YdfG [Isoptericola halotolerans]